jgi:sortase A
MTLHATWIPLKAELAQALIERSWRQALAGGKAPPPWPWADTRPLAVLEAPRQGIRLVVLEGNSGRNLAFGPVLDGGSAHGEDRVISGHRDTHFVFLRELAPGDRLRLTDRDGARDYAVVKTDVVDSRDTAMVIDPGRDRLSLVTCWPFDSPAAGGPLRYVVTALPAGS